MARRGRASTQNIFKAPSGTDMVMTIAALGALGVAGYVLLKYGGGLEDALKSTVDAGNSIGDYLADGSCWLQGKLGIGNPKCKSGTSLKDIVFGSRGSSGGGGSSQGDISKPSGGLFKGIRDYWDYGYKRHEDYVKREEKRAADTRDAIGESIGNGFCWFRKTFFHDVECTDLNKRDLHVLTNLMEGGSPKPVPKITNNTYNTMLRIGVNPYYL